MVNTSATNVAIQTRGVGAFTRAMPLLIPPVVRERVVCVRREHERQQ